MKVPLETGKFNIVFGGQAGSEGKGKVACCLADHYLRERGDDNLVFACNHMPNAGHTFRDGDFKYVAGQLPTPAIFNNKKYGYTVPVVIGPGSAIRTEFLEKEVEICGLEPGKTLFVHPNAGIVTQEHLDAEDVCLDNVSSTKKGGGACLAAKVMRQGVAGANCHAIARDLLPPYFKDALIDTAEFLNVQMKHGKCVLYEGAQGFDLDINHGLEYPFTTSRMSNVSQALAESGVPPSKVGRRIMVLRPYPIRVGNAYDKKTGEFLGTSGPYAADNHEIDWDEVKFRSNTSEDVNLVERTTVTNKIRRVFTFSVERYTKSMMINDPTDIVVTFIDHIDRELYGKTGLFYDLSSEYMAKVKEFFDSNHVDLDKVRFFSSGPDTRHVIYMR